MTELAAAVVSITRTARGRYFWAAWWTHPPRHSPFQKPDASGGGAATREAAFHDATKASSDRHLSPIQSYWAHSVNRMLRGDRPPPPPEPRTQRKDPEAPADGPRSAAQLLGVSKDATLAELKKAYRARSLATHPDRGGDPDEFRLVQSAYERLAAKRRRKRPTK